MIVESGDILLLPFPFSGLEYVKVRPAVLITVTKDKFKDIVVAAITSVVPDEINENQIILSPSISNNLKKISVLRADRIFTLKQEQILNKLGKLDSQDFDKLAYILSTLLKRNE